MWRLLHAAFGLHPLPYHLFNLGLHLASTALVYRIGGRLLQSRAWAAAAAVLFGVSSIAFTPMHWTSCMVELLVTVFSLAAFQLWLIARDRGSNGVAWLAAIAAFAALLSKENAVLLPLVMVAAHFRLGAPRPPARFLAPPVTASVAYVIAFLATLKLVHFVGSEAYAMSRSPGFLALNLGTYLAWLASPNVAVRDAVASVDPSGWKVGLPVGLAMALILWTQRRERRHPEEVGAAWFLAFLLPVVPLAHHTYLYYLYLPLPGVCWMVAGALRRGTRALSVRAPAAAPLGAGAAVLLLLGVAVTDFMSMQARERAMRGTFPLDKTIREAMLLRNAVTDLGSARFAPGTRFALVNPAKVVHFSMTRTTPVSTLTYIPLEAAIRNGDAIRLFHPGLQYLGLSQDLPPKWEKGVELLLYMDEGTLRPIGCCGKALSELGYFLVRGNDWERAEPLLLRSRELGDTLADATIGLILTRHFLGHEEESDRYAREFLRRWPNDPRANALRRTKEFAPDSVAR